MEIKKLLSEGLGALALGLKKLKKAVNLMDFSAYELKPPSEAPSEAPSEGAVEPAALDAREFITNVTWKTPHRISKAILKQVLGENVRADKYKNQWVKDHASRRGWRKIAQADLSPYYQRVRMFKNNAAFLATWSEVSTRDQFQEFIGVITPEKWAQRKNWSKVEIDYKMFLDYLRQVHDQLPSLR